MAGKKPPGKRGPKVRPDSAERAAVITFRAGDLYPEFNQRMVHASRVELVRRDLRRYYTLVDHQLRQSSFRPADVERLGREFMGSDMSLNLPVAPVLASYIDTFAKDVRAESLVGLSTVDAVALADLYARSSDPADAAARLAEMQA